MLLDSSFSEIKCQAIVETIQNIFSCMQIRVIRELLAQEWHTGKVYLSLKTIAKRSKTSIKTVQRTINKLSDLGWVIKKNVAFLSNEYFFNYNFNMYEYKKYLIPFLQSFMRFSLKCLFSKQAVVQDGHVLINKVILKNKQTTLNQNTITLREELSLRENGVRFVKKEKNVMLDKLYDKYPFLAACSASEQAEMVEYGVIAVEYGVKEYQKQVLKQNITSPIRYILGTAKRYNEQLKEKKENKSGSGEQARARRAEIDSPEYKVKSWDANRDKERKFVQERGYPVDYLNIYDVGTIYDWIKKGLPVDPLIYEDNQSYQVKKIEKGRSRMPIEVLKQIIIDKKVQNYYDMQTLSLLETFNYLKSEMVCPPISANPPEQDRRSAEVSPNSIASLIKNQLQGHKFDQQQKKVSFNESSIDQGENHLSQVKIDGCEKPELMWHERLPF